MRWFWLLLGCVSTVHAEMDSTIKCWTNEEGVRECGSVMPPQYSGQGYKEVNPETGVIINEVSAEKTAAEIQKLKEEEVAEVAKQAAIEAQQQADQTLLDNFPSVDDIDIARDAKLLSVATAIKVASERISDYQRNLIDTKNAMAQNPPQGEDLKRIDIYINQLEGQIKKTQAIVVQKKQEQDNITKEYQEYKRRFFQIRNNAHVLQK
jgi:flagellar biosynthesis chaperone FliJ